MATFGSFVSGQVLTAAELNSGGTFDSYTPTWTQSATITKTTNWARYTQFNKLVIASIKMTASSAGTANNKILIGLPVSASANNFVMGTALYTDANNNRLISVGAFYESSTTVGFFPIGDDSGTFLTRFSANSDAVRAGQNFTTVAGGAVTGITVASGDIIYVQLTYEAA